MLHFIIVSLWRVDRRLNIEARNHDTLDSKPSAKVLTALTLLGPTQPFYRPRHSYELNGNQSVNKCLLLASAGVMLKSIYWWQVQSVMILFHAAATSAISSSESSDEIRDDLP